MDTPPISNTTSINEINQEWAKLFFQLVHELTTPIATIRLSAQSSEDILKTVFQGYQLAVEQHLIEPVTNPSRLHFIKDQAIPNIADEAREMQLKLNALSDMIKLCLNAEPEQSVFSIQQLLANATESAELCDLEIQSRLRIQIDQDFYCQGSPFFTEQALVRLLHHLVQNATVSDDVAICIAATQLPEYNELSLESNTIHASPQTVAHNLFKHFLSPNNTDIKPGLGLCRIALLQHNIRLSYAITPESTLRFIFQFPLITTATAQE